MKRKNIMFLLSFALLILVIFWKPIYMNSLKSEVEGIQGIRTVDTGQINTKYLGENKFFVVSKENSGTKYFLVTAQFGEFKFSDFLNSLKPHFYSTELSENQN
ncbi:hypothetical protein ABEW00_05925 [Rossellomorea vietnamensis]|uniref:hypothetical protein n=1 Tax=Rossellomorea vietnamensis TaxID=218284 RepID=UPI003D26ADA4